MLYQIVDNKTMKKNNMQDCCNTMNHIIKENKEDRVGSLNEVMCKVFQDGGNLYRDRDVFIACNGDDEKMRGLARTSSDVRFGPSDDPQEHLGVVSHYDVPLNL